MTIEKINTSSKFENWYRATQKMHNGAVAIGWGSSFANAIVECLRDMQVITKL
jgi:hypothetical protein